MCCEGGSRLCHLHISSSSPSSHPRKHVQLWGFVRPGLLGHVYHGCFCSHWERRAEEDRRFSSVSDPLCTPAPQISHQALL